MHPALVTLTGDLDGEMNIGMHPDNDFLSGDFISDIQTGIQNAMKGFSLNLTKTSPGALVPVTPSGPQLKNVLLLAGGIAIAAFLLSRKQ